MTEVRLDGMRGRPWYEYEDYLSEQYNRKFNRAWMRCVWPHRMLLWLVLTVGGYPEFAARIVEAGSEVGEAAWMLHSDNTFGASAVALGLEPFRP